MKKVYLLDTNIVSEFAKEKPDENVVALYQARKNMCAISAVTWQELVYGFSRMPGGKRKNYIEKCLEEYKTEFEVIPYDSFAADICGKLLGESERKGKLMALNDAQIAATAVANGMVLVTRNTPDFKGAMERAFLRVENWFGRGEPIKN